MESADLVVRDGKLWMRSLGTFKRVDVVLRRVDATPIRSTCGPSPGVVGLVERSGASAVTVVNSLGSGILESPGLAWFLPELAQRLLGETRCWRRPPMYWGGIGANAHLLVRSWTHC